MMRINRFAVSIATLLSITTAFAETTPDTSDSSLQFSSLETDTTPSGQSFHGPFLDETLSISTNPAEKLPAHEFLDVSVDLLILRSWDGSVETLPPPEAHISMPLGPDYLRIGLLDGRTLLYTTFSNRPDSDTFRQESKFQNYPSQVPGEHLAPQTGADAKNTLGYWFPTPNPAQHFQMDATYKLHFIIPHSDAHAAIQLTGMGLSAIDDENWGVTNVHIRALRPDEVKHSEVAEIEKAFATALDASASDQPAAFQTLILGMNDSADWIRANVQPQPVDTGKITQYLQDINADDTKINERYFATYRFIQMGAIVEPYLRDARKTAHAEQRFRIDKALMKIGTTQITDENVRRVVLATRVLEIIGTPHALEVRKALTESN